jgi:hypothetical protein
VNFIIPLKKTRIWKDLFTKKFYKTPINVPFGANDLLNKTRRLDMGTAKIDIDKLLDSTANLTSEKYMNKLKKIEIDKLLEQTQDWLRITTIINSR